MRGVLLLSVPLLLGMCAVDKIAIPNGGIGKAVLIVRLWNGSVLKTETPYLTGTGHLRMAEFIEDNHGTIKEILFAGETVTGPDGTIQVKDTSSLNAPDQKQERNHSDLKNYAKYVGSKGVVEKPRKEGENYLYPELNGLDARLNTIRTENIKHDVVVQEIVGLQMHIESAIKNREQRKVSRPKCEAIVKGEVFSAILDLVERDGISNDRLVALKNRLLDPKPLLVRDWKNFKETLFFYFHLAEGGKKFSEEDLSRLIQVQTLSEADKKIDKKEP